MKNILITGANGFIGKNLAAHLQGKEGINIIKIDLDDSTQKLQESLKKSDWIFHLAGVNRPQTTDEFNQVNAGLTETIIKYLQSIDHNPNIVFSSSTINIDFFII